MADKKLEKLLKKLGKKLDSIDKKLDEKSKEKHITILQAVALIGTLTGVGAAIGAAGVGIGSAIGAGAGAGLGIALAIALEVYYRRENKKQAAARIAEEAEDKSDTDDKEDNNDEQELINTQMLSMIDANKKEIEQLRAQLIKSNAEKMSSPDNKTTAKPILTRHTSSPALLAATLGIYNKPVLTRQNSKGKEELDAEAKPSMPTLNMMAKA